MMVGMAGLGYWGKNLLRNLIEICGSKRVVIYDTEKSLTEQYRDQYNVTVAATYEELLNYCNSVVIATPTSSHFMLAKQALASGVNVLLEKPATNTLATLQSLYKTAEEHNALLMVDYTFLYSAPVMEMKRIISSGQLGDLVNIDSKRVNLGIFRDDTSVLGDLASHDVSIIDYLCGIDPQEKNVIGNTADAHLFFGTLDGCGCHVHVSWMSPVKIRQTVITGSRGTIVYDDLEKMSPVKLYPTSFVADEFSDYTDYTTGDLVVPKVHLHEPLSAMLKDFLDCCEFKSKEPVASKQIALNTTQLLDFKFLENK